MITELDHLPNSEYTIDQVESPILKLTTLWGLTLFTSTLGSMTDLWLEFPWGVLAQFLASIYGFLLIYFLLQKHRDRSSKGAGDGTK